MTSDSFIIDGLAGKRLLKGNIPVYGAKNHALKAMAAAALIDGTSHFVNVPGISDVDSMARILEGLGAFVSRNGTELSVNAKGISETVMNQELAKSMRASVVLIGPLLARLGSVTFPHPGGDVIGERPIDLFISGFEKLGAEFTATNDTYTLSAPQGLHGGEIFFRVVSVTATETLMMAATLAKGPVTLKNCAMEPEVIALGEFLKSCGAKIEGLGTTTIAIEPSVMHEPQAAHAIIPDRMEAATFLALGALAADELVITGAEPAHLDAVFDRLSAMGVSYTVEPQAITVRGAEFLHPTRVRTHEYPGFPTDAQAPFAVLMTQAEGESTVRETIFDGRLNYATELVSMGAHIEVINPHRATVKGKTPLKARAIQSPDIRAGLAYILAAVVADGQSTVGNAHHIDRGYADIEKRLAAVGLDIRRAQ